MRRDLRWRNHLGLRRRRLRRTHLALWRNRHVRINGRAARDEEEQQERNADQLH